MRLLKSTVLLSLFTVHLLPGADGAKRIDAYSFNPISPLVIVGEGWSQQFMISNVDDEEAMTGTLEFFTAEGQPWEVELRDRGRASTFFVTLLPGQMAVYETVVKQDSQVLGWAEFDLDCCAQAHAQTVFRKQTAGRPDLMTSLTLGSDSLRRVVIPFDNRDGKFAGVGVLVTEPCFASLGCEAELRWRFRDSDGSVFEELRTTQAHQTLNWFSLVADHPETVGRLGSLEISSTEADGFVNLVGFSLQFAPNGAFTVVTSYER